MTTAGTPNAGMTHPTPAAEPYKLRRVRKGRMLAGVASGLATASGLDVTVVRICIGASMLTGLGVIGYILLWIVIPEEQPSRGRYAEPAPESTARVIRVLLLGGALVVLLQRLNVFWPLASPGRHTSFGFDGVLALVLLSLGVGVLVSRHRSDSWLAPSTSAPTAPPPSEPFTPWTAPTATDPADDDPTAADASPDSEPTVVSRFSTPSVEMRDTTTARVKKPGGAALGWARVAGWLALLWWVAGLLALLGLWRFGAVNIATPALLFTISWVVFTVVLNALIRVRKPAIVLATLCALVIPIGIAQGTVKTDGPVGTRTARPLTAPAHLSYRQSIGELELDLSDTRLATSRPTRIDARIGTGAMLITLPDNVSVTVVSRIEAGGYDILGKRTTAGVGQRETLRFDGCAGAPHLQLRLRGGAGWIHVTRASGGADAVCEAAVQPEVPAVTAAG